jgi:purine nucleosidase
MTATIIEAIMEIEPGTINLVPTGPLTNIALAMKSDAPIVYRVKRVILMSGPNTRGNKRPSAEFNVIANSEAAQAVFARDWPVKLIGLGLTHQAAADTDAVARIAAIDSLLSDRVVAIRTFFGKNYREVHGFDAPPVHDLCCATKLNKVLLWDMTIDATCALSNERAA